jgi:hypothetical protein
LPSNTKLSLTKTQIGTIQSLIIELKLLDNTTDLEGIMDSSVCDGAVTMEGCLTIDSDGTKVPFLLKRNFMLSGFRGNDVPTFYRLLQYFEQLMPNVDLYRRLNDGRY